MAASSKVAYSNQPRVKLSNIWLDTLTEQEVVSAVREAWARGLGGSIITVNSDIALAVARHTALADLIAAGSIVVADGMPLVWAARIAGKTLPGRVTGSSLIFSLSEAAAADGRTAYLLGGADEAPTKAAMALCQRFTSLQIAGSYSPRFGFDQTDEGIRHVLATVARAAPDLVFVGLGFPRQEQLIKRLRQELPEAWFLACGAAIPMAAGDFRRASPLMQRLGLEWVHRLALEPRRLAGRYIRDDLPFAIGLLAQSVMHRLTKHVPYGDKAARIRLSCTNRWRHDLDITLPQSTYVPEICDKPKR